jgi:hypothetical protein
MSWNSQAAQIAAQNPATATALSTATPTVATHFSGGFNFSSPPEDAPVPFGSV